MSPQKRLLFAEELASFPQAHPPSGHLAEILVVIAAQRDANPTTQPAPGFYGFFEHKLLRQVAVGDAAQLNPDLERLPNRPAGSPLHIETDA